MRGKIWWILAAVLAALAAACLWLVPGVRFSGVLCAALAVVCLLWLALGRLSEISRFWRICKRIFLVGFCGLTALVLALEVLVISGSGGSDASADAVLVLGAGVNGETPSLSLQSRIDAAADYLLAHPGIPAVLSGGQGPGEDITEAEAMYRGLTARGVEAERLFLEDRSASTAENFAFSKAVLEEAGVDLTGARVAVVSNGFHLFRACLLAEAAGLDAVGVAARLPWWLDINYYLREPFALVKTWILDIAMKGVTI